MAIVRYKSVVFLWWFLSLLGTTDAVLKPYLQEDTASYLESWETLHSLSMQAMDSEDAAVRSQIQTLCAESVPSVIGNATEEHVVTSEGNDILTMQQLQEQCNHRACVIPAGLTVQVTDDPLRADGDIQILLAVHSLTLRGSTLVWNTSVATNDANATQGTRHAVLCAGFIAVEDGGSLVVDQSSATNKAWIFIRNNGAVHPVLGTRALGAVGSSNATSTEDARIEMRGASLSRTWSLLAKPLLVNDTTLQLRHNPVAMGWRIGDRIAVAPTLDRGQGRGQAFTIIDFPDDQNTVVLNAPSLYEHSGHALLAPGAKTALFYAAEVVHLSRNIIVTGDDFAEIPCDPSITTEVYPGFGTSTQGCYCSPIRASCTVGLHTAQMFGGTVHMEQVRIEYCGQRGIEGKYCFHLHQVRDCPDCVFQNNVIEYSVQRGIVIHDTHRATIEANVLYNVRGAAIYVEDGNELYNTISYNVAICPWTWEGDGGCTVPGTSNAQGDTALNQAGLYMENPTQNLIGNRMVNHFNGMFLNPTEGHGPVEGAICANHMPFGLWEGNTFHSSGRFGTYGLNDNYPLKNTGESISSNGIPVNECLELTADGNDNGLVTHLFNNMDYGNAFVGHYGAGDIQYHSHSSLNNLNAIYWKETKSFQDGCSAHISHSYVVNGTLALPDTIGSFIIEHSTLHNALLEANHHCGIGVTGFLCMPHYVLDTVDWIDDRSYNRKWVAFTESNDAAGGGIFGLAPSNIHSPWTTPQSLTSNSSFFPLNYVSLVSGFYTYLVDTPFCVFAGDLGLGERYDYGILCERTLQTMRIYSNGSEPYPLLLQVYNVSGLDYSASTNAQRFEIARTAAPIASYVVPFYAKDGGKKRGYKFPVLPDDGMFYHVSLMGGSGNIPSDWFIDFGDLALSNRYGIVSIQMEIQGRACNDGIIPSNHDRLFLSTSIDDSLSSVWGHGACTEHPVTAIKTCSTADDNFSVSERDSFDSLEPDHGCPDLCGEENCAALGAYCDCFLAACKCLPGRYGDGCQLDVCSSSSCVHGGCASKYLGSRLAVSYQPCLCEDGWSGLFCDTFSEQGDGESLLVPPPTAKYIADSPSDAPMPAGQSSMDTPPTIGFDASSSKAQLIYTKQILREWSTYFILSGMLLL